MKTVKDRLLSIVLVLIIVANASNSIKQIITLVNVKAVVNSQAKLIARLEVEEHKLADEITYSQSREYKDGAQRKLLGLGSPNDFWVLLPPEHTFESLYPQTEVKETKAHWQQWLNLIVANR